MSPPPMPTDPDPLARVEAALRRLHEWDGMTWREYQERYGDTLDFVDSEFQRLLSAALAALPAVREEIGRLREALLWAHGIAHDEHLRPWSAWSELDSHPQRRGFHCWGCEGEFISIWPRWEEPTVETFPHRPECKYLAYLQAVGGARA